MRSSRAPVQAQTSHGISRDVEVATSVQIKPVSGDKSSIVNMLAFVVGGTVVHPTTGIILVIAEVLPYGVLTTDNTFILTTTAVGETLPDPADPTLTVKIKSVTTSVTTGLVERVEFEDGRTLDVASDLSALVGAPGSPAGPVVVPSTPADINDIVDVRRGSNGGGGRTGALFVSATSGGNGGTGPSFSVTVPASNGNITTTSTNVPGILVASIGGNGGRGGDGYAGASGKPGGSGGAGGNVSVTSLVGTISTTGNGAHGVAVQSRSGVGGRGGGGFLFSSAGSGGAGNSGGSATATSYSTITTRGTGAHGVFAQSLGGGAGSGGSSYGLFGNGGGANNGGNGSTATVINYGDITTFGASSHGVAAMSIGGLGGDAGNAGGIVAFSDSGSSGGNGGTAVVRAQNGSDIRTEGAGSYGLFAQSVGGSGGNGSVSGGLVAIGAGGGTGGNGSNAQIYTQANTTVVTLGASSHGIFAQSLGGGGGNSGIAGGTGGNVYVDTSTVVRTGGTDAHGVFAQSVGGGGGNALGTGGVVAVGGSGSGAGTAGTVTVLASSSSDIRTTGRGSHGIFAQSVGGGGGNGSASGGVVSLGGSGGAGGNGSTVTVSNQGVIATGAAYSRGIFAQSVGGGGGNGGDSGGLFTIGGTGSAASAGGIVTVTNAGSITTSGNQSAGIQAQSIGGGGGDGGSTGGVFLTIGGGAGGGGTANTVTVNHSNNIATSGEDSHGIFAQSVGGGGGNGGSSVSVSAFAGVAIGGAAGDGGDGGTVNVNFSSRNVTIGGQTVAVDPSIVTTDDRSRGVFAQSVGGGGGNGGFAVQVTGGYGAGVSIAVGGSGGKGGAGNAVNLNGDVTVRTEGNNSEGILAQSVGGGGGNGGFTVSFAGAAGPGAGALSVGVGGSGGDGGAAGTVTVNSGGAIVTEGEFSTGFIAQSLGGGGGNGGFNVSVAGAVGAAGSGSLAIGVGGSGGGGGNSNTVDATFNGTITTSGDDARGALIQSAGGGGGQGGFNVSGSVAFAKGGALAASIGVGGSGGSGGNGSTVIGHVGGHVDTSGERSDGVVIQSVGGGGGAGGFNVSGSIGGAGVFGGALAIGVGGSGGDGGNGGSVTASSSSITTRGDSSTGFLAQSAGGGGGTGGMNVSGTISGSIKPGALSVGVAIGVGGAGGGGGDASSVNATVNGNVITLGMEDADAIVAQSMGGGGGNGGLNVSGNISFSNGAAGAIGVGVGGAGGGGGNASSVDLTVTGTAATVGTDSDAIVAQSVGGGGGNGAVNVTGNLAISTTNNAAGTIGVSVGGSGGSGGRGGNVSAMITGVQATPTDPLLAAYTTRADSRGIIVQSVGGGGGNGGISVAGGVALSSSGAGNIGIGVGGSGGGGGNAGTAHGDITGNVTTVGDNSSAVLVQSAGGGGGAGGLNVTGGLAASKSVSGNIGVGVGGSGGGGGTASTVTGSMTGDIETRGQDADAFTYQSVGGGGGTGGLNVTGTVALGFTSSGAAGNIGVGVGGSGGSGGNAGNVTASHTGSVYTYGHDSHGLLVQSAGGGGGNGGLNVTGSLAASGGFSGTIGVGVGGMGSGGGNAGTATGTFNGDVVTAGNNAFGAMVQSAGGGGGNGGVNVTGAVSFTTSSSASVNIGVGVGGFGGGGGTGSTATGNVTGLYATTGANADGVVVQSMGGGGGNGGINVTGLVSMGTGTSGTGAVGIGGFGGGGGNSGAASLTRAGNTSTSGADSDGIVVQSIAGGGGNGAINVSGGISATTSGTGGSFGFGLGGFGGGGGNAGNVTANVTGSVWARGVSSDVTANGRRTRAGGSNGVVVQSVGGGGGNGGLNVTGGISISTAGGSTSRAASIGIGGFGGSGGNAGTADLTLVAPVGAASRAQVLANGDDRIGVLVQSLGGSGGNGGINVSGSLAWNGTLAVGIGGFGGGGGTATTVTANVDADVWASGNNSRGLAFQSIGGGGGHGGINVSAGVTGSPSTAESSLAFGMGGNGGAGNRSGNVTATQNGQVMVEGLDTIGVLAQSVAGGGGSGALNVTSNINLGGTAGNGNVFKGYAFGIGIGGSGGDGANAGDVTLNSTGTVIMNGQAVVNPAPGADTLEAVQFTGNADAIVAQSIGGGGGAGGVNVTSVVAPSGNPMVIAIGGSGGAGGHGGNVTVTRGYTGTGAGRTANGALTRTFGNDSVGIIAQSVGGGGGLAGVNAAFGLTLGRKDNALAALINVGGDGGNAANGGNVTVDHYGNIITNGNNSHGIYAQSTSDGGGSSNYNLGFAVQRGANALNLAVGGANGDGGTAGTVDIDHVGTIVTGGNNAHAIFAQSVGGGGGSASLDMATGVLADNSLDIVIGRLGGTGGTGGAVTVDFEGDLDTTGTGSKGIFAQSIGGGGGGSSATSVGFTRTTGTGAGQRSGGATVTVGLQGGTGAAASSVTVNTTNGASATSSITTRGTGAHAIHAQSTGGGGGAGGGSLNFVTQSNYNLSVGVGGVGGSGGTGGNVTVTSAATLRTTGETADGIFAQSLGGGGGTGGYAATLGTPIGGTPSINTQTSYSATVNVGGAGGTGMTSGRVDVTNTGTITTPGRQSYGIRAQSVGGGGGDGGIVMNVRGEAPSNNYALDVNVGGFGGSAAGGGAVNVINEGLIYTTGNDSAGISANSIGGGGGNGGLLINENLDGIRGSQSNSHRFTFNIGGNGGTGGTGGAVSVINRPINGVTGSGTIITEGSNAYGIFAQSLGGGGGNGSSVISLSGQFRADQTSSTFGFNLGGQGGSGETGGSVTVDNSGLIDTTGNGAHGILAQSIGGGGGNGGIALAGSFSFGGRTNTPTIAIGGSGGDGGNGGTVTVTNSGNIVTRGDDAHGIVAQSIGGGGGNSNIGLSLSGNAATNILSNSISALVGALTRGSGGTGGNVVVNHSGDITVLGARSQAIKAESINGGGGSLVVDFTGISTVPGGSSIPLIGNLLPPNGGTAPDPLVAARAGSNGSTDMNAGRVTVNTTGTFGAGGNQSTASLTQGIGGGGGSSALVISLMRDATLAAGQPMTFGMMLGGAGGTRNNGGDLSTSHTGSLMTIGTQSPGLLMQSVGGGGGLGLVSITAPTGTQAGPLDITVGGSNGTNEAGGSVARTQDGMVATAGAFSPAVLLQSIGGGGGLVSASFDVADTSLANARVTMGANGGTGLSGGAVSGTFTGGILTQGDDSLGLLAQSIGAGGGVVQARGMGGLGVQLGGQSGAWGDGGAISLSNNGAVTTTGSRAHGVFLQSIGGGGGFIQSDAGTTAFSLSAANRGDGGSISYVQAGDIVTGGTGSHGIVAQSIGGGGGWIEGLFGGTAGGNGAGGSILIDIDGNIWSTGSNASGVYAQSLGSLGGGDIIARLTGAVRGGEGAGRGLFFDGGANNTVTSSGSLSAVSGLAIEATTGDDTIINQGLVVGNVDLGSGANRFDNQAGATFIAFDTIDMRDPAPAEPLVSGKMPTRVVQESADIPVSEPVAATDNKAPASLIQDVTVSQVPADKTPSAPVQDTTLTPAPGAMFGDTPVTVLGVDAMQPEAAQVSLPVSADPLAVAQGDDDADELLDGADVAYQMASQSRRQDPAPVRLVQDVPPTRLSAPIADATFSNSGTFNMGLAASRLPIDLLNGDTFGNLDHLATPQTNLLFGARVINTVALDGNFEQTASGHMAFDVAYGPYASDRVDVTGDAAFAGTGEVILTWLQDDIAVPLFQVAGTTTDNGLEIADTMAVDFSVAAESDGLYLNIATDFGGISTLNRNDRALGGHMDSAVQVDRSAGIGRLLAFLGNMQAGQEDVYAAVFRELNPEAHVSVMQSQLNIANTTAHDLFRCGAEGSGLDDQCVWSRIEMNISDRESSFEAFSVDRSGARFAGGVEQPLGEDWSAAVAIAFEESGRILVDEDRARLETQSVSAALGLQRDIDRGFTLGASLSGGWSWGDSLRQVTVFQPGVGEAEFQTGYLRMEGQVARQFGGHEGGFFATPSLTVSGTALRHAGLAERGLDGLGITVQADTQYVGAVAPELTFGHIWQNPDENKQLVTSLSVGTRLNSTDRVDLPMRFVGANPVSDAAMIGTLLEDVTTVSAGIQFIETDRVSVDFGVDAEFGDETQRQRAGVDIRLRF